MSNPLLEMSGLPPFSQILPEHVEPAVDAALAECRAGIAALDRRRPGAHLGGVHRTTGGAGRPPQPHLVPVGHLNGVMNSDALRAAYNACLPKLSAYGTEVGQNADLFRGYQAVAAQEHLDQAQRKLPPTPCATSTSPASTCRRTARPATRTSTRPCRN